MITLYRIDFAHGFEVSDRPHGAWGGYARSLTALSSEERAETLAGVQDVAARRKRRSASGLYRLHSIEAAEVLAALLSGPMDAFVAIDAGAGVAPRYRVTQK